MIVIILRFIFLCIWLLRQYHFLFFDLPWTEVICELGGSCVQFVPLTRERSSIQSLCAESMTEETAEFCFSPMLPAHVINKKKKISLIRSKTFPSFLAFLILTFPYEKNTVSQILCYASLADTCLKKEIILLWKSCLSTFLKLWCTSKKTNFWNSYFKATVIQRPQIWLTGDDCVKRWVSWIRQEKKTKSVSEEILMPTGMVSVCLSCAMRFQPTNVLVYIKFLPD